MPCTLLLKRGLSLIYCYWIFDGLLEEPNEDKNYGTVRN